MSNLTPVSVPNGMENTSLFASLLQSNLGDNDFRFIGWEIIKATAPIGVLDIPNMMEKVEVELLNAGKPLLDNVNQLFKNFRKLLKPELKVIAFPKTDIQVTEFRLNEIQKSLQNHYEDRALKSIIERLILMIWELKTRELAEQVGNGAILHDEAVDLGTILGQRVHACTHFLYTTNPPINESITPESIRAWFQNPVAVQVLQQFVELDISCLNLKVIPPEIFSMTALQSLRLDQNGITFLPEQIKNLINLQTLALSQNDLTSLPKEICDLPALHTLYLSHNQLRSLPKDFNSLSSLRVLHFTHNQLISFPEQLGNMPELAQIRLTRNPLMFSFDEELLSLQDPTILRNRYQEFLEYPSQSYLGNLLKLIGTNADPIHIQNAFEELDSALQQKITEFAHDIVTITSSTHSSSSDTARTNEGLCADIPLLARAVRGVTLNLFSSLSEEQKNNVHQQIWKLAGSPETDNPIDWGQQEAFNNTLRFVDALEEVSKT